MANYTAADVKKLRELTAAGMLDCKNALVEADGDFDKAEYLIKADKCEEAIPLLQQVVATNARDADALNYLGQKSAASKARESELA